MGRHADIIDKAQGADADKDADARALQVLAKGGRSFTGPRIFWGAKQPMMPPIYIDFAGLWMIWRMVICQMGPRSYRRLIPSWMRWQRAIKIPLSIRLCLILCQR